MRFGSSTNHLPILRVLLGPTTHSRECPLGARNSMSPSPTVSMANASMNLLFHTVPSPPVFVQHHELADSTTSPVRRSANVALTEFSEVRQDELEGMKHNKRAGVLVPALGIAF